MNGERVALHVRQHVKHGGVNRFRGLFPVVQHKRRALAPNLNAAQMQQQRVFQRPVCIEI